MLERFHALRTSLYCNRQTVEPISDPQEKYRRGISWGMLGRLPGQMGRDERVPSMCSLWSAQLTYCLGVRLNGFLTPQKVYGMCELFFRRPVLQRQ